MKKQFGIFILLCMCALFISCEDDDDRITLTVHSSAYDVFSTLKDVDGVPYFTNKLPDGLEVRFCYFIVREADNSYDNDEVVAKEFVYVDDINSTVSYTTGELIPGVYNVYVTTDLVKGDRFYNSINADQYLAPIVKCDVLAGVYNAFGTAFKKELLIEEKTEITLDTQRKGSLVTLLFKNNAEDGTGYKMSTENFEFYTYTNGFSGNTKLATHTIVASVTSAQHYCASATDFYIGWDGGYPEFTLTDGRDKVIELDFATGQATQK